MRISDWSSDVCSSDLKKLTGKAAQTVGGVGLNSGVYDSKKTGGSDAAVENVHKVAERLARGEFDLVGVGRAIIHDPEWTRRSEEHTSELQSLMRISYAVFCLKKKKKKKTPQ